jgi:hypothetical protein
VIVDGSVGWQGVPFLFSFIDLVFFDLALKSDRHIFKVLAVL